jgi:glycosyltransferase 2 family protein
VNRKRAMTIIGFLVSIALLYLSLRGINFHDILAVLQKADVPLLPLPVLFILASAMLCAFRWSKIAGGKTTFKDAFVALIIGLFVNNVLPARIGELARGYVLSKRIGSSFTYGLSTVLLDRFFDLIGLLILTVLFLPTQRLPSAVVQGIYMLLVLVALCIAVFIVMSREGITRRLEQRLGNTRRPLVAKFARRVGEIRENLRRIHSPLNVLGFTVFSVLIWFSMSVGLYSVTRILDVPVPFLAIPFVCALLNMGLTIPSSPGYIGVYQFLLVYLLSLFGVPKAQAFAVSVLFHASWYIPYNIIGFVLSVKEHVKVRDIEKLEDMRE